MKRRTRLVTTLGLVALVIIDIALVVAALRIGSRSSAAETPAGTVTETPTSSASSPSPAPTTPGSTTSTSAAPSTSPSATSVPGAPLQVVVYAVDGTTAWRATTGACGPGGATVQITTDGGKTWRDRTSPYPVVTRLQADNATKGFVVGADGACSMGVRTTTDGGGSWPGTGNLADTLARDAKDPTKVRAPGGRTVAPCGSAPVVDLARNSPTGAQVLCADGSLRSSTDDGASWSPAGSVTSGLALDSKVVGGTVTAYVAWVKSGCAGVQISSVAAGKLSDLGCAAVEGATPGKVALAAPSADTGWLVVGATTLRGSAGLASWSKA